METPFLLGRGSYNELPQSSLPSTPSNASPILRTNSK